MQNSPPRTRFGVSKRSDRSEMRRRLFLSFFAPPNGTSLPLWIPIWIWNDGSTYTIAPVLAASRWPASPAALNHLFPRPLKTDQHISHLILENQNYDPFYAFQDRAVVEVFFGTVKSRQDSYVCLAPVPYHHHCNTFANVSPLKKQSDFQVDFTYTLSSSGTLST
jgi:hypothetical protein